MSDTGIGIAPEQLGTIFDPFHQAPRSDGLPNSGFGFGLYLVKQFVDAVGGRIEVESTPGNGSTFRVRLPPQPRLPMVPAENTSSAATPVTNRSRRTGT